MSTFIFRCFAFHLAASVFPDRGVDHSFATFNLILMYLSNITWEGVLFSYSVQQPSLKCYMTFIQQFYTHHLWVNCNNITLCNQWNKSLLTVALVACESDGLTSPWTVSSSSFSKLFVFSLHFVCSTTHYKSQFTWQSVICLYKECPLTAMNPHLQSHIRQFLLTALTLLLCR